MDRMNIANKIHLWKENTPGLALGRYRGEWLVITVLPGSPPESWFKIDDIVVAVDGKT